MYHTFPENSYSSRSNSCGASYTYRKYLLCISIPALTLLATELGLVLWWIYGVSPAADSAHTKFSAGVVTSPPYSGTLCNTLFTAQGDTCVSISNLTQNSNVSQIFTSCLNLCNTYANASGGVAAMAMGAAFAIPSLFFVAAFLVIPCQLRERYRTHPNEDRSVCCRR